MIEYDQLCAAKNELIDACEQLHECDVAWRDAEKLITHAEDAYAAVIKFGVTKEILSLYNSDGFLDYAAGDVYAELEYYDTLSKSTLKVAKEKYSQGLENYMSAAWETIKQILHKFWEAIKNFFRAIMGQQTIRERQIRHLNNALRLVPIKDLNAPCPAYMPSAKGALVIAETADSSVGKLVETSFKVNAWYTRCIEDLTKISQDKVTKERLAESFLSTFSPIIEDVKRINPILAKCNLSIGWDKETCSFRSQGEFAHEKLPDTVGEGKTLKDAQWDKSALVKLVGHWANSWKSIGIFNTKNSSTINPYFESKLRNMMTAMDKASNDAQEGEQMQRVAEVKATIRKIMPVCMSFERAVMTTFMRMDNVLYMISSKIADAMFGSRAAWLPKMSSITS